MRKVVLVTGTSTGLGTSVAVAAARSGHKVYATMRSLTKRAALDAAAAAANVELEVLPLDVQDAASIDRAVDAIVTREGRIDVVVNNAGAGFVRTTEQATEDEIRWVIDVNLMGVIRCTKAVIAHMRKQRSGHIITISSVGGLVGQPFNELYCAAKFGVEGYMESLATYVTPNFGIHFTAVEPGGIKSEFAANVLNRVNATGGMLDDEYLPILQKYIGGSQARRSDDVYQTPDQVAAVVMSCMENPSPPIRIRTSPWAEKFSALKTQLDPDGTKLQAQVIAQMLT